MISALSVVLALTPAAPAAAVEAPVGYKIVDASPTLDMLFLSTNVGLTGTVVLRFQEIPNTYQYQLSYTHVASGSTGYKSHTNHPGTYDKHTVNGVTAQAAPGTHWVGLAGAFFPNTGKGYEWMSANFANPAGIAIVPDSALNLSVTVPGADDDNFDVGEEMEVRVTIEADPGNAGTMTNVNWTPLTIEPADMVEVLSGPTPPGIPQNFSLFAGGKYVRSYKVRSLRPGTATFSTNATGKSANNINIAPGPATMTAHFDIDILKVEVEVDEPLIQLEDTGDGPIPQEITATVKVTNVFDEPVEQVAIDSLHPGSLLAPPPFPGALTVIGGPFDPDGPNPEPANLGTIEPGETVTRTYTLEASNDGHYELVGLVTFADPFSDGGLTEIGRTQVKISGDVVLYFDSTVQNVTPIGAGNWVEGGHFWRVSGTIENRSSEDSILVLVQPNLTGNAFYGQPVPDNTSAPDSICAMGIARVLEPLESVHFLATVRTLEDGGTRSVARYEPKGFLLGENDSRTPLTADQVFFEEGATEHLVHVNVADEAPVDASTGELVGHYLVGAVDGLGRFAEGIVGLVGLAAKAIALGLQPWEWPEAYRSAGDKVAKYLIDVRNGLPPADKAAFDDSLVAAVGFSLAMPLDDARTAVDAAVEERFTDLTTSWETGDSRAVAQWFGEISGENPDLVLQALVAGYGICKLAHRGSLTVQRGLAGIAESQAATLEARAAQGARALKAGDQLNYEAHLARIFGIDKLSDRLLRELAEKWNIMVVVRRRGAGVIEKLKTGRFRLKPFAIKAKNVSPIDVDWLGFPPGRLDEVVIKQPPPWAEVETRMKAAFQDPEKIAEVHERWHTRWKEWYGKGADEVTGAGGNMAKSERGVWKKYEEKGLAVGRNTVAGVSDNVEAGFSLPMDDTVTEMLNFRGDLVLGTDGRPCLVANIEDPIKGFQGVTGDIDPMAFLRPDGTILPQDVRLKLYRAMRHLGFQHPESLTWNNPAGRNAYMEEFSVHNPASETMACYRPDGRVTAARFDPGKSWIDPLNAKTAAMMYIRGGPNSIRSNAPTPTETEPLEELVEASRTVYVAPNTWAIINANCPGNLIGHAAGDEGPQVCPLNVNYSNDPDALVLRQSSIGKLERWSQEHGWRSYVPSGSDVFVLPQTALAADVEAGTTVLQIHDLEALGLDPQESEWFAEGHVIILNPGGDNEETATIDSFGSIILEQPLQFDHAEGELISVLPQSSTVTTLSTTTTTLFEGEPPEPPSVSAIAVDPTQPMSELTLTASPIDDPDGSGPASAVQVMIGGPLDNNAKGAVYFAELPPQTPLKLHLPPALLDPNTQYTVIFRYIDSDGLASDFSQPFALTTAAVDPDDTDNDDIEDEAELAGPFDVNGDGIPDSTQRIAVVADGEAGDPFGLFSSHGQFGKLRTFSEAETLDMAGTPAPGQLPLGTVASRVDKLMAGQAIAMTYYLDPADLEIDKFISFDPAVGFLDRTAQTSFAAKWMTVTRVDGGLGDLDGVANGRIVDTGGPAGEPVPEPVCAAPLSQSQVKPTASDCLYILRTAVGSIACSPACRCAPKGTLPTTATDSLICLKAAVGVAVQLKCPCM